MAPNILVFLTDDHAQWALPSYGNSEIYAPTLSYLANTGVQMANAFTPTPVCSPARASFWTGLYPSQHGIHDYLMEHDEEIGTRNWLGNAQTLAQYLQGAGYQTGLSGKWHCGRGDMHHPGFDYWYSTSRSTARYDSITTRYSDHGKLLDHDGYETQVMTDNAIDFLRNRDESKPFFLFIGYCTTHSPWYGRPERLVSHYRKATFADIPDDRVYPFGRLAGESRLPSRFNQCEARAQYYAAVTQIDEMVGRVMDELDALALRDETLVVYTADHGLNAGQHGVWGKGNGTRPLNMLEESIRIPLIFNHPGELFAGQIRPEVVNHTDTFMTLLDYAEALPEDTTPYPGRSFEPMLTHAQGIADWPDVSIGEYGNLRAIRTNTHKLVRRYPDGPHQLFDLLRDPRETTNLFDDATYADLINTLTQRIDTFFAQYEDETNSGLNVRNIPHHNPVEAWRGEQS